MRSFGKQAAFDEIATLRAENERLEESVNASRAEATLRFEESQQWRQKAQVIDDGLCMAKERIAELEAALRLMMKATVAQPSSYLRLHCRFCYTFDGDHKDDCPVLVAAAALKGEGDEPG